MTTAHELVMLSDKDLFSQIALGDEPSFRVFFDRYKVKLYYFVLHIVKSSAETEEVVQDVFLRLWISRDVLAGVNNPGTYIFVMARNRSLDYLKNAVHDKRMKAMVADFQTDKNFTEEDTALNETRQLLEKAIRNLPGQQQKIYRLSREAGLTRTEIADQLNISPNTVRNHLADALSSIRNYMKDNDAIILLILLTPVLGK